MTDTQNDKGRTYCQNSPEPHWHVKPCKHGKWPQMFCKNCNGVYKEKLADEM